MSCPTTGVLLLEEDYRGGATAVILWGTLGADSTFRHPVGNTNAINALFECSRGLIFCPHIEMMSDAMVVKGTKHTFRIVCLQSGYVEDEDFRRNCTACLLSTMPDRWKRPLEMRRFYLSDLQKAQAAGAGCCEDANRTGPHEISYLTMAVIKKVSSGGSGGRALSKAMQKPLKCVRTLLDQKICGKRTMTLVIFNYGGEANKKVVQPTGVLHIDVKVQFPNLEEFERVKRVALLVPGSSSEGVHSERWSYYHCAQGKFLALGRRLDDNDDNKLISGDETEGKRRPDGRQFVTGKVGDADTLHDILCQSLGEERTIEQTSEVVVMPKHGASLSFERVRGLEGRYFMQMAVACACGSTDDGMKATHTTLSHLKVSPRWFCGKTYLQLMRECDSKIGSAKIPNPNILA